MNWSDVATVFHKDWAQSLRDRKTLLIMLVGVLATPLATTAVAVSVRHRVPSARHANAAVVVVGQDAAWATRQLQKNNNVHFVAAAPNVTVQRALPEATAHGAMVLWLDKSFREGVEKPTGHPPIAGLYVDNRRDTMNEQSAVNRALDDWRDDLAQARGAVEAAVPKVEVDARSLSSDANRTGNTLGLVLPMNLALTILLLGLYASTELVTAERERGTMVLLAVAPPSRRDVLIGKILVVFATCLCGAMLSLLVHFALMALFVHELADTIGPFVMSFPAVGCVLSVLLVVPLIAFLSAISFTVACLVRNFQQAQSYASVLLIVCLLPALATVVATRTYPPLIAAMPIANNALAMRDALAGMLDWRFGLVAAISSTVYAVGATMMATRLLDSEHAVFPQDEPPDTWRWTARWLVLFLGFVFLAFFVIGQPLQSVDTLIGLLASQVLVIGLPVFLFAHWLRLPTRKVLQLVPPRSWLTLPAAVLLAPLTVLLGWSIGAVQELVLPTPKALNELMMQILLPHGRPLWLLFAAVAAAPAICEELLFRGCVQGVLLRVLPPRIVLPITALGFGAFHMSTFRLLPTTVLGFVLCWLAYRFGSIFPCMVLHFSHNALATWVSMHHIDPLTPANVAIELACGLCGIGLLMVADRSKAKS